MAGEHDSAQVCFKITVPVHLGRSPGSAWRLLAIKVSGRGAGPSSSNVLGRRYRQTVMQTGSSAASSASKGSYT